MIPELVTRFSAPDATPTSWDVVRQLLESAELFWISTVRSDGRPHVVPLPAVWREDALYFATGPDEQKAVNLSTNDACVLTTGNNRWKSGLDVCVEGSARRVTDETVLHGLAAAWDSKYEGDWQYEVRDRAFWHRGSVVHVFEVRPHKVLAFAKGDFAQTRFRFGER